MNAVHVVSKTVKIHTVGNNVLFLSFVQLLFYIWCNLAHHLVQNKTVPDGLENANWSVQQKYTETVDASKKTSNTI